MKIANFSAKFSKSLSNPDVIGIFKVGGFFLTVGGSFLVFLFILFSQPSLNNSLHLLHFTFLMAIAFIGLSILGEIENLKK